MIGAERSLTIARHKGRSNFFANLMSRASHKSVLTGLQQNFILRPSVAFSCNVAMIMINKSKQSLLKVCILASLTILFLFYYVSTHSLAYTYSRPSSHKHNAITGDAIPNHVHYVHIMPSSSTDDGIAFELKHFI